MSGGLVGFMYMIVVPVTTDCGIDSTVLGLAATCHDGMRDGDETGVDCGGTVCPPCAGLYEGGVPVDSGLPADSSVPVDGNAADGALSSDSPEESIEEIPDSGSDAPGNAPCPSGGGTTMVRIPSAGGSLCIDATETTDAQYAQFLATVGNGPGIQPPECAGAPNHAPAGPLTADNLPVVGVNWCDAYAYCVWAGKRLCGQLGTGGNASAPTSAADDEWFTACSHGGTLAYPYGASFVARVCNDSDPGHRVPVGSIASCVGGYPGLFDMSGNVWEWESSCTPGSMNPLDDTCMARGGSYASNDSNLSCHGLSPNTRSATSPVIGFRCCAD
jgi:hypothetical protein